MIIYDKLWEYLKKSGITQYRLVSEGISHSTLTRLKRNQPVTTETLAKLCAILSCKLEDIAEYKEK